MFMQDKFVPLKDIINLSNKHALVTGAAMGIGYAIAFHLAEAGAAVTIVDFNEEKGAQAAEKLKQAGFKVFFIKCNVAIEEEVKPAVQTAIEKMGGIDILVNNAGIYPSVLLDSISTADIDKILNVNLKSVFYFTREASRNMLERKSGSIINLASVGALHPINTGMSLYDASKGAVVSATKSLAKELGANGIRVNAIAPGGILTEGAMSQTGVYKSRADLKEFLTHIPLRHMGTADDIGRAALFLASDLSSYMTGSLITVDGGYLIS